MTTCLLHFARVIQWDASQLECQMFSQWYNVRKTFCRVKSTKGDFHTYVARAIGQAHYLLKSSLMGVST